MNLIEHYIKEVHSEEDVTNKYEEKNGIQPNENILKVDLTYNCYGVITRETRNFFKSEWEIAKLKGYFMG